MGRLPSALRTTRRDLVRSSRGHSVVVEVHVVSMLDDDSWQTTVIEWETYRSRRRLEGVTRNVGRGQGFLLSHTLFMALYYTF